MINNLLKRIASLWWNSELIDKVYIIEGILLFTPLVFHHDFNINNTVLETNMGSIEVFIYAACALSTCIPLVIDVLLDMMFCRGIGFLGIRLLALFALVLYCSLFIGLHKFEDFGMIVLVFSSWGIFTQAFITLRLINNLDRLKCYSSFRTSFILTMLFTSLYLHYFELLLEGNQSLSVAANIMFMLFYCGFLVLTCLKIYRIYENYRKSEEPTLMDYLRNLSHYQTACLSVIGIAIVSIPAWAMLPFFSGGSDRDSSPYLKGQLIIRSFLTIFTVSVPGRMFKTTALEETSSMNLKTEWVSFISHELRTPLHIISMGLQLSKNEIEEGKAAVDILPTIKDLDVPCSNALELLNDLIYLESTESHTLELHRSRQNPFTFVKSVMKPLASHARERGVILKCCFMGPEINIKTLSIMVDDERFAYILQKVLTKAITESILGDTIEIELEIFDASEGEQKRDRDRLWTPKPLFSLLRPVLPVEPMKQMLRIKVPAISGITNYDQMILKSDALKFTRQAHEDSESFGIGIWIMKRIMRLHEGDLVYDASPKGFTRGYFLMDLPLVIGPAEVSVDDARRVRGSVAQPVGEMPSVQNTNLQALSERSTPPPVLTTEQDPSLSPLRISSNTAVQSPAPRMPYSNLLKKATSSSALALGGGPPSPAERPTKVPLSNFSEGSDSPSLRLLVVDDSALTRKILVKVLVRMGHSCIEANDGSVAVDTIRTALVTGPHFDAILMDNEMPIMRGRDAVLRIREMGFTGVILGVTGNVLKADIEDFIDCGADKVLLKPMSEEKFRRAIAECQLRSVSMRKLNVPIHLKEAEAEADEAMDAIEGEERKSVLISRLSRVYETSNLILCR